MKKYLSTSIIALLAGAMAITFSACGHRHHDPEKRAQWMMDRITAELDLNAEQQTKLLAVKSEIENALEDHRRQKQQAYDQLLSDIKNPTLDKQMLMDMVQSRQKTIEQIAPAVIDKVIEFHASLSPEQKDKVVEHMQEHRDHWKAKHHL